MNNLYAPHLKGPNLFHNIKKHLGEIGDGQQILWGDRSGSRLHIWQVCL